MTNIKRQDIFEKRLTFDELRRNTFNLLLLCIGGSTAVMIWLSNIQVRTSRPDVVALWLAVEAVCGFSYLLQCKHFQLAILCLISGLWLCNAYAAWRYDLVIFLNLFALISLAASVLTSRLPTLLLTVASSIFILSLGAGRLSTDYFVFPLVMLWFTLFTGLIAFHSLSAALDIAWNYQNYAIEQMMEAREHRGNLMQTTKTLNEVRQDLERVNTQLSHAREAAEVARRLKAQFAANVSHELRTPINLIVGFTETIVVSPASYGVPLPPVYWADMNTIYRSAKHLQSLINDVLDVSQIEAGQMSVVKEEINPRQVILEASNLVRELIESRGLVLNVQLPESLPQMYLDRTRIRQVLINLLSNAARFTDSGSITLRATLEESQLLIEVSDTGIGIPPKDLNHVFEEFHQVEGSLSRRRGGSGLGLTLSKQFVELHGGRIWASSQGIAGDGSTFSLTLPLVDHSVIQRSERIDGQMESGGKYFVVLDDDPAILQLFERYTHIHRAVGVKDVDEAIRLVSAIKPTAVVVDDNNDCSELRAALQTSDNQTPIITCAMPNGRYLLHANGSTNYLSSSVSSESLRETLEKVAPLARHILVISGDRDIVRMFTRMLNSFPRPYHIWEAYSSEEGLELMRQQRPDVVVLDSDDHSLMYQIEADPALHQIQVIVAPVSNSMDELMPASEGRILLEKVVGFQPLEMVRCVEALIDVLNPASEPVRSKSLVG
jgi:signal transduction histidine kinase/CheY-like chemotaxis protein